MTALDILVLILLGGGAMIGFVRGFVHEALSLLAWVAAIVALKLFHTSLTNALSGIVGNGAGAWVLAFALLSIPVYIAVKLLAKTIGGASRRSVLGPVDRLLGGGFGMLKGLILATFLFLLANLATDMTYGADADRPEWMAKSRTFPLLNATSRSIVRWAEERRRGREATT